MVLSNTVNFSSRTLFGSDYTLNVLNHPLPYSDDMENIANVKISSSGINGGIVFIIGFSMSIVAALFVILYIRERISRAKLLQLISGVDVYIFWLVSYLWDFLILLTCFLITIVFYKILNLSWTIANDLPKVFLLSGLFALAVLPLVYIASLFAFGPMSAYTNLSILFFFTGIGLFLPVSVLRQLPNADNKSKRISRFFRWFPHFNLMEAITNIDVMSARKKQCNDLCKLIPSCNQKMLCQFNKDCCCMYSIFYTKNIFTNFHLFQHLVLSPLNNME